MKAMRVYNHEASGDCTENQVSPIDVVECFEVIKERQDGHLRPSGQAQDLAFT